MWSKKLEVGVWTFKGEAWAGVQHIGEIERPERRRAPGRRERLQRVGVGNEEQLTKTAEKEPRKYSKVKRVAAWKSVKSMCG